MVQLLDLLTNLDTITYEDYTKYDILFSALILWKNNYKDNLYYFVKPSLHFDNTNTLSDNNKSQIIIMIYRFLSYYSHLSSNFLSLKENHPNSEVLHTERRNLQVFCSENFNRYDILYVNDTIKECKKKMNDTQQEECTTAMGDMWYIFCKNLSDNNVDTSIKPIHHPDSPESMHKKYMKYKMKYLQLKNL